MRKLFASVAQSRAASKFVSAIVLFGLTLSSFGLGPVQRARTQQVVAGLLQPNPGQPVFPDFRLPYSKDVRVYWTGGPHGYNQGGDLTGVYTAGQGSGLDFSNGSHFELSFRAI